METLPQPAFCPAQIGGLVERIREPAHVLATENPSKGYGLAIGEHGPGHQVVGILPPLYPEWLGDRTFGETHGTRFPYVAGEMAGGIATVEMVVAMARGGMLGFFGAGGLGLPRVHEAVAELKKLLLGVPNWGVNLIHSPNEPATENEVADLLIRNEVPCVCASAFTDLTPAVVRCSAAGLTRDAQGRIVRRTRMFAKISRPETAEPVAQAWAETERFWQERDPAELARARTDPKHRMALVLRSYLGRSSRWAVDGDPERRTDFQIWCGPAIGAFNRWTAGTFLAEQANRTVVQIALNLPEGAAVIIRAHQLRVYGLPVPPEAFAFTPRRLV